MTALLLIIGLLLLVLINVPIAVALGFVAIIGMMSSKGFNSIYNAALTMFDGATNFPLLAIPLFILAGALMNTTTISRRLINLTSALIGFVRGGLAMVNVGVSMFFAEISGSAVADVAAIGSVLIPAMKKRNYTPELSAAVTSSSASIAIIIPPSIAMIIYGALVRHLDRPALCRRHHSRCSRRLFDDGALLLVCRALRPAARRSVFPDGSCGWPSRRRAGR